MSETKEFKKGDKVKFLAGPRSTTHTTATVTGHHKSGEGRGSATFLVTKDAAGTERKIRPGACQIAA